ncbi:MULTISPECIES: alpha/beta fold hydrolase [unclassified Streptomyces]|uniref:thioesterase II family protein n=1 Tax=unclassified Streptomyces TaxID=2593676 RepID=UPI00236662A9|nr:MULTISPECIES: alpha/beta fold hydrolase [unclassified Streptomyces]MDF3147834.1 alpha/beta fold hydrolase [Streptomyces sp. T21Q-yed]WDF41240.1 alpha/beta fold hydrolase [Streptomyces sp. T12]
MTVPDIRTLWFRGVSVPDARIRLLCFPHAGGGAVAFHDWAALAPPEIEVVAVQYPGRQDRVYEPCASTMEELADAITTALQRELPGDRPLAFFGHSMGSSVAYEVARRLEDDPSRTLTRLIVSGRQRPRLPQEQAPRPAPTDPEVLDYVRLLDPEGADLYANPELQRVIMPALRADFGILAAYRPTHLHRLGVPVTVCGGDRDPVCTVEDLKSWSDVTTKGLDLRVFEGAHFYLRQRKEELLAFIAAQSA